MSNETYLQVKISEILRRKTQLEWLLNFGFTAKKIVDFGCSHGVETLALMYYFEAIEAVGLDKDKEIVLRSLNESRNFRKSLQRFERMIHSDMLLDKSKNWWDSVPEFFKYHLLQDNLRPEYLEQDITKPSMLPSEYYDLAYCRYVLNHIAFDKSNENALRDTQYAIFEMARVTKPGGIIAAKEPVRNVDKSEIDYQPMFEQAGLKPIHINVMEYVGLDGKPYKTGEYCFKKK